MSLSYSVEKNNPEDRKKLLTDRKIYALYSCHEEKDSTMKDQSEEPAKSEKWTKRDLRISFSLLAREEYDADDTSCEIGYTKSKNSMESAERESYEESNPQVSSPDPCGDIIFCGVFFFSEREG